MAFYGREREAEVNLVNLFILSMRGRSYCLTRTALVQANLTFLRKRLWKTRGRYYFENYFSYESTLLPLCGLWKYVYVTLHGKTYLIENAFKCLK